jgi:hypothetical protein
MVHVQNFCPSFIYHVVGCALPHVVMQPYEAFQAQARLDHTSFSWYFDFNLVNAAKAAVGQNVAIVFLLSDSGEGSGSAATVDSNWGDRYAARAPCSARAFRKT